RCRKTHGAGRCPLFASDRSTSWSAVRPRLPRTWQLCIGKPSERAVMTDAKTAPLFNLTGKRVYVAGHAGMVGAALVRRLGAESCSILTADRTRLDLTCQAETHQWIGTAKPDAVILAAAKVGGIAFNDSYPVDFLSDNLAIALNVIRASY